jgi:pSer/pThr/pTyr-binding forkhead associated (FHA) protein
MNVRLVVCGDQPLRQVIPLRGTEAVLGRALDCAVRIPSSSVSRRHCRLSLEDGQLTVADLGSVNGTFLNGELIVGTAAVHEGDELRVGPVTFRVEKARRAAPGPKKPKKAKKGRKPRAEPAPADIPEALVLPADEPAAPRRPRGVDPEDAPLVPLDDEQPTHNEPVDLDQDGRPWTPPDPGQLRDLLLELDADPGEEDE